MAFNVSIITAPKIQLQLTVDDINIVKHALLFADRVTLYSPNLALLQAVRNTTHSLEDMIATFRTSGPAVDPTLNPELVEKEVRKAFRRPANQRNKKQKELVARLKKYQDEIRNKCDEMLAQAGFPEIQAAVQEGLVALDDFGINAARDVSVASVMANALGVTFEKDDFVQRYVKCVAQVVLREKAYPLADDQVSRLVEAGIREGKFLPHAGRSAKMKTSMLSWSILQNLPLNEADVETILEARSEVSDHADAFRAAVARFANTVKSEAWESSFEDEADHLFQTAVVPEITKIEKALHGSRALASLGKATLEQFTTKKWATGTLALLAGFGIAVVDLPAVAVTAVSLAGTGLSVASDTLKNMGEGESAAKGNDFFLYYKAERTILTSG